MYNMLSLWLECCNRAQGIRLCGIMAGAFALRVLLKGVLVAFSVGHFIVGICFEYCNQVAIGEYGIAFTAIVSYLLQVKINVSNFCICNCVVSLLLRRQYTKTEAVVAVHSSCELDTRHLYCKPCGLYGTLVKDI